MIQLGRVEIPGFSESLRKERTLRDSSFANTGRKIGPFTVRLMTLRDLCWLDAERNGLIVPCQFEKEHEAYAHALALIWHLSPGVSMPENGHSMTLIDGLSMLLRKVYIFTVGAFLDEEKILRETVRYIDDRFYDSPKSGKSDNPAMDKAYASGTASVVDLFAAGGYCMTESQILDMPLDRLWQYGRLITQRLGGKIANPSDWLAANHLETIQKGGTK